MARGQNIIGRVFNRPLLITPEDLKPITDYLSNPERVAELKFESDVDTTPKLEDFSSSSMYEKALLKSLKVNPDTMVGTLNIEGLLVNRSGQMSANCTELTSYQKLKSTFLAQVDAGMKTCVMMINSGGGEAFAAWSTANYIRKVANENGVKLVSYVNGSACSAAYVWACIADEVVSHPMSQVGSIGVVIQLYNDSEMLKKAGYQRTFICAGDNKIPFDKEGNFTDKFIQDLQKSVDKTYNNFVKHVVSHRGLNTETVVGTQASVYDADDAIELGLVDRIMELEDFETHYGLKVSSKTNNSIQMATHDSQQSITDGKLTKEETMSKQVDTQDKPVTDEMLNAHADNQELLAELTAKLSTLEQDNLEKASMLAELNTKVEGYESKIAELNGVIEQKELAHRTEQRKAMLEDALGKDNEKVETLLATTEALSDEQFEVIAQSLSGSQAMQQQQLQELGGEGQESNVQLSLAEQMKKTAEAMNRKA